MRANGWRTVGPAALLAIAPSVASAQAFRLVPQFQLNFPPPGARSLGVGGAFTALADDATAGESNPAGLIILSRPELSAHLRVATNEVQVPDDIAGGRSASFQDSVWSPIYASFVLPLKPLALSVYYNEFSRFRAHSFFEGVGRLPIVKDQVVVTSSETDLLLSRLGLALAVRLHPLLSVGGSVRLGRGRRLSVERLLTPAQGTERYLLIDDFDYDFTYNAGVLLNPAGQISAGFVYKQGDEFEIESVTGTRVGALDTGVTRSVVREVPDVYGGGVAFRLGRRLTVMADLFRVTYSVTNAPLPTETVQRLEPLQDENEIHAGAEYVFFAKQTPVSLRAGMYTDPDHEIFADVDSSTVHGTVGFGFVIERRFQLDLAVNLSKYTTELQVSTVYRF